MLNHICFESRIDESACDEISIAIDWVNHLPNDSLTIYDRGYASFTLVYLLTYYQRDFVIRCKIGFNQVIRDFVKSRRPSALVNFPATNRGKKHLKQVGWSVDQHTSVAVRLVKGHLDSGETEVLITARRPHL